MKSTPLDKIKLDTKINNLKELSNKHHHFTISQNENSIVIKTPNGDDWIFIVVISLIYGFLIFLMGLCHFEPVAILAFSGYLVVISLIFFLYFKFGPTTNDIVIDLEEKAIKISSNNILGKHVRKPKVIKMESYKGLRTIEKSRGGSGYIKRVFLIHSGKKIQLIDLPLKPVSYCKNFASTFNKIIISQKKLLTQV